MQFIRAFILFCIMSTNVINAKSQLINVSNSLLLETDHTGGYLGSGVSFADFNNDDIDDLTFGHHGGQLRFYQGFNDETGPTSISTLFEEINFLAF
jgi:hypothetical protein